MSLRFAAFSFIVGLLVCGGCGAPVAKPSAQSTAPATAPATAAASNDVQVAIGGAPEFATILEQHQGQVVLVDFWATWCPPCVEGYPHTVELAKKYRKQGLVGVTVSLDDPDNLDKVKTFLAENNSDLTHLLARDGASTETMEAFQLNEAVPHYRLYDRTGKLRQQWDGLPEDLEQQIQSLLEEKTPG
ncbi:MAG TPA: TlpA disulfide reductase family protein [Pirellulaceae bacterium]|nr:TlpA disulfide reductase family protein [Pirellulaceae bacterium]